MSYWKDNGDYTAFVQGWLVGRALALRRKAPEKVEIPVLAATFDPLTAQVNFGESGTLGNPQFVIGYTGMPIWYSDGHLIVEDTQ